MDEFKGTTEEIAAREAASWLERLKTATPKEQAEFARWLRESRANVREMLLASSWETVLHHLGHQSKVDIERLRAASANVVTVTSARPASLPARALALRWPWIAAVGVSMAIAAAVLLGALPFLREVLWHEYVTSVGEQRTIALADGSIVSLNARSNLRVVLSSDSRDVYLTDGQALFSVAHDTARPFRVHVGTSVVQAVGTKFDVHRLSGRVEVAVLEGRVRVEQEPHDSAVTPSLEALVERTLSKGEALSISNTGKISVPVPVKVSEMSTWRQRRLIFRDRPLGEIVEEFQRYNAKPRFIVEGSELRNRLFNGVFDADEPEAALAAMLATDESIALEHRGNDLVIRTRPIIVQSAP
jgi:transmembrane sensor